MPRRAGGTVARNLPHRGRERCQVDRHQRHRRRRHDALGAPCPLDGVEDHRRAQDAGARVRRLRHRQPARRRPGPRHVRGRGADEHLRAQARQRDVLRYRAAERGVRIGEERRSPGRQRRDRGARRLRPRVALQRERVSRQHLRPNRIRALRLLPARRRIGWQRQGREVAPGSGEGQPSGRQRALAASVHDQPRGKSEESARSGDRGAQRTVGDLGASASSRDLLASRTRRYEDSAVDSRRRRRGLRIVEGRHLRLHDHRQGRTHYRKPRRRRAAAAGDERRTVAASIQRRIEHPAWRLHAQARRVRGRSPRHDRASDSRGARGCAASVEVERADGRRSS